MTIDTRSAPPQDPSPTQQPIEYAPPPGPPPTQQYAPPPGPPPTHWQPHPLLPATFPLLSSMDISTLATQGYTTFPIAQRPTLYDAAASLFNVSRTFFAQPQTVKTQFQVLKANAQGSEEGWSRVEGEKELLTLRRGGAACPPVVEERGKALWGECGVLMQEVMRGVEQSLGMTPGVLDHVMLPECAMPGAGADRVETLLRMFRYERRSEADDTAAAASHHADEVAGKGRLVSEPHRDLGLLSLVIGASPGLEVLDTKAGRRWVPIEQPPYAADTGLTATLLVGETLTCLTNGRYAPGRHRVFVPSVPSSLSPAAEEDSHYRYSLVFALRPHPNAIISTTPLTTTMTGPFSHPLIDVRGRELFTAIAQSHWNVNTDRKAREVQKLRLKKTGPVPSSANGNRQEAEHHHQEADMSADNDQSVSWTSAEKKHRWSLTMFGSSRAREDGSPEARRRWPFFKCIS